MRDTERTTHELVTEKRCSPGSRCRPLWQHRRSYAADPGGIRTTVTLWLDGQAHEAEVEKVNDNTWTIRKKGDKDTDYPVKSSGGGVFIDEDGINYGLEAQDVTDS